MNLESSRGDQHLRRRDVLMMGGAGILTFFGCDTTNRKVAAAINDASARPPVTKNVADDKLAEPELMLLQNHPIPSYKINDVRENPFLLPPKNIEIPPAEFRALAHFLSERIKRFILKEAAMNDQISKQLSSMGMGRKIDYSLSGSGPIIKLEQEATNALQQYSNPQYARPLMAALSQLDEFKKLDLLNRFMLAENAFILFNLFSDPDHPVPVDVLDIYDVKTATVSFPGEQGKPQKAVSLPLFFSKSTVVPQHEGVPSTVNFYDKGVKVIVIRREEPQKCFADAYSQSPYVGAKVMYAKEKGSTPEGEFADQCKQAYVRRVIMHEATHGLLHEMFEPLVQRGVNDREFTAPVRLQFSAPFGDQTGYRIKKYYNVFDLNELAAFGVELATTEQFPSFAAFEITFLEGNNNELMQSLLVWMLTRIPLSEKTRGIQAEVARSLARNENPDTIYGKISEICADPAFSLKHVNAIGRILWQIGYEGMRQQNIYLESRRNR
ncbi:hypothetical protein HYV58_01415 [Candidatus Peregrinibacteria bacterium]|nr:hypothetical protein [Candidatus Peregrinibacteria bacterium]